MLYSAAGHTIYQHQDHTLLSHAYTWFDGSADLNWTNELRNLRNSADPDRINQIDLYCNTLKDKSFVKFITQHADTFLKQHYQYVNPKSVLIGIWPFAMTSQLWHDSHNHPDSFLSGTYYVQVPSGAGDIYFHNQELSESISPTNGMLLLWHSDIRHSVPRQEFSGVRQAISFDLALA